MVSEKLLPNRKWALEYKLEVTRLSEAAGPAEAT